MEKANKKITSKQVCIVSIILLLVFCIIFIVDGIDAINHKHIGFDEAWNATVAANVARGHGYTESYQSPGRLFPTVITTGQTVLLPTAILYKLFGVSLITSSIIPLLFGMSSIIVTYIYIYIILKAYAKRYEIDDVIVPLISVVLTIFSVLSRRQYDTWSTGLLGETAALFFILISGICIFEFYKSKKTIYCLLASGLQVVALLTKPEVIMINVTIVGCLVITSIVLKSYITILWTILGCITGLVVTDLYKFIKMGASIQNYIWWWGGEIRYMFQQSSGVDLSVGIEEKIKFLSKDLFGINAYVCMVLIFLPVLIYGILLVYIILKKGNASPESLSLVILGTAASSLEVFFLLLGGKGLIFPRRHFANAYIEMMCAWIILVVAVFLIWKYVKKHKSVFGYIGVVAISAVLICMSCPFGFMNDSFGLYIKKQGEDENKLKLMKQLITEIDSLGEDTYLYTYAWWQEPNVTLFLDKTMKDINQVSVEAIDFEKSYFIIGQYFYGVNFEDFSEQMKERGLEFERVDNIHREDYGLQDNYSIFKIVKADDEINHMTN